VAHGIRASSDAIINPFSPAKQEAASMSDEPRGAFGEDPGPEGIGDADALNWACTNCGYRVEGDLPEKCPDCGAPREDFDQVPIPGF
jgi:rubrerythrin